MPRGIKLPSSLVGEGKGDVLLDVCVGGGGGGGGKSSGLKCLCGGEREKERGKGREFVYCVWRGRKEGRKMVFV